MASGNVIFIEEFNVWEDSLHYKNRHIILMSRQYWEGFLRNKLAAQALPDATPPIGQINSFSKMAVTFEPLMGF